MRPALRLWCAMALSSLAFALACAHPSQSRSAADLEDVDRPLDPSARMQVDDSALAESRAASMRELGELGEPEARSRSEMRDAVDNVGTKNEVRPAPPSR